MKKLIFLFFFLLPIASFAQDLYIKMEANAPPTQFQSGDWVSPSNNNRYLKAFQLIGGNENLHFICVNRATLSQVLPMSALANYPTAQTSAQVMATFQALNSAIAQEEWAHSFKNFYIIQVLPATNQIEVSKVKIMDFDISNR